ncbi:MAG: hypothetical protein P8008_01745 [Gammaproteobacteria bacterium]
MTRTTLISLAAGALLLAAAGLPAAAWAGHGYGHGQGHGQGHGRGPGHGHGPARVVQHPGHRRGHQPARHGRHGGPVVGFHPPPPPRAVRHRHGRGCAHRVFVAPRYHPPRVAIGVHYDGFYFSWNGGY